MVKKMDNDIGEMDSRLVNLFQLVQKFILIKPWINSKSIVLSQPELLGEEVDLLMESLIVSIKEADLDEFPKDKNKADGPSLEQITEAMHFFKWLLRLCKEIGVEDAYREASRYNDSTLSSTPPKRPDHELGLQVASEKEELYLTNNDLNALNEAIGQIRRVLDEFTPPDLHYFLQQRIYRSAGSLYIRRYWAIGHPQDLEMALSLTKQAVNITPNESPEAPSNYTNLGNCWRAYYAQTGQLADLDKAMLNYQNAVSLSPTNPSYLTNLGSAWYDHYFVTGNFSDLIQAVEAMQQAVDIATDAPLPDMSFLFSNLSSALLAQYQATKETYLLNLALEHAKRAVDVASENEPRKLEYINTLSILFFNSYMVNNDPASLQAALETAQKAENLLPDGSPIAYMIYNSLGICWAAQYELTREPEDWQKAFASYQKSAESITPDSPRRPSILMNLSKLLYEKYQLTNDLHHLDDAINFLEQALSPRSGNMPDLVNILERLGSWLLEKHQQSHILIDLNQSIDYFQQLISISPLESIHPIALMNYVTALLARYDWQGKRIDLEKATEIAQKNISITSQVAPDALPQAKGTLGVCLRRRYERTGDFTDLENAVTALQQAVSLLPEMLPARLPLLNHFGSCLRERYIRNGQVTDLENAIKAWNELVKITPEDSLDFPARLNSLGIGLFDQYNATHNIEYLEEAIRVLERVTALTVASSSSLGDYLNNLGNCLTFYAMRKGQAEEFNKAVKICQRALSLTAVNKPAWPRHCNSLGIALRERYRFFQEPADLAAAVDCFRDACGSGLENSIEEMLRSSRNWGIWAMQRENWVEAIEAFEYGQKAITLLLQGQAQSTGKQIWLEDAQVIPISLAYALAKIGKLEESVVALEQGRTRLLVEAQERTRQDLARLKIIGQTKLYERYQSVTGRILQLEHLKLEHDISVRELDIVQEMRVAQTELSGIIRDIQHIPSYEDFFKVPDYMKIQAALISNHQAGIYLLIVEQGGVALIVHEGGIQAVWLDVNNRQLDTWLVQRETYGYLPAQLGMVSMERVLNELLPSLGKKIMEPLAITLRLLNANSVVLIPTGRLALLPLHAVPSGIGGQQYGTFIDEFNVTYAPSARALWYAKEQIATKPVKPKQLLAISNPLPLPKDIASLVFARAEVEEIEKLFVSRTVFYENAATRSAVDAELNNATYLHFSCHGFFNPAQPLDSGLLLSNNDLLTVRDLITTKRFEYARLAVLSACQTAVTDFDKLPEEAVGLPSGFLQAGVIGIVGTLWAVNDLSTALLMIKFYNYHLVDGLSPSEALRNAQLWLRDITNAELSEIFDFYRQRATERPASRLAFDVAQTKFREYALSIPDGKPFVHPFFWAPFIFCGV